MVQYQTPTTPIPAGSFCLRIVVPNDTPWRSALFGALDTLTSPGSWVQSGLLTPDDTVQYLQLPVLEAMEGGDWCMIGAVWPYASATPPPHTLQCDGTEYSREDYPNLYDALDPAFILDDDTFYVPDLINRFVLGADPSDVGDFPVGSTGGEQNVTLTTDQIPSHTHTDLGHQHLYTAPLPGLAVAPGELPVDIPGILPTTPTLSGYANIQNTGGGAAHNNMPPWLALRWCIVYE